MLYIVTYATHEERYLNILKQSCPDLIVLGFGEKWNGFGQKCKGIIDFCKSKNPDDIICFIDGFDCIFLSSKEELLKKYENLNKTLIFSKILMPVNIFQKYTNDKFGKCKRESLNTGMYIGTCTAIIDLWKDIKEYDDDQEYAMNYCIKNKYIDIDIENKLFYNISSNDQNLPILNKRIIVNNEMPCSISGPGAQNINHILEKIGYTNLPEIKLNYYLLFKHYFYLYLLEFLFIVFTICILYFFKNKFTAILMCFIIFLELIHYELYIKHLNKESLTKLIYISVDLLYLSAPFVIFYLFLFLKIKCISNNLILLNIFYLGIFLFFILLKNSFSGIKDSYSSVSIENRLNYFVNLKVNYDGKNDSKNNNSGELINIKYIIFCIVILNCFCLWKLQHKKKFF
jgi:hypothetical protein